jgi:hypothetical protein
MKYQNQSKCILLVYIQLLLDQIWRRAEPNYVLKLALVVCLIILLNAVLQWVLKSTVEYPTPGIPPMPVLCVVLSILQCFNYLPIFV